MNELQSILDAWRAAGGESPSAVLATVVHVTGSAYRRPGARMLILPDGRRIGSISGGCLEGDLCRKAWWFTEDGRPSVRVYDTTSDDDAVWEFGLGCNGVVQVLLERLEAASAREAMQFLDSCRVSRKQAVMATVIRISDSSAIGVGDRLYVNDAGVCGGTLQGSPLEAELLPHAHAAFLERKSRLVHLAGCEVFVEWIGPPVPLVVFGAGHDAIPVVAIAKQLGWHVTVADGRPAYAKASRFPSADRVVLIPVNSSIEEIEIGPETAVVLMTHNYPLDEKLLPQIVAARPRYLGLLGPKKRAGNLFARIGGLDPADVYAPVGLDIGADTPESIALSIVAEIQAAFAGRTGKMLRYRSGPIHAPAGEVGKPANTLSPEREVAVCEVNNHE
jgi:xanthine dehydrogenase accessory factor